MNVLSNLVWSEIAEKISAAKLIGNLATCLA